MAECRVYGNELIVRGKSPVLYAASLAGAVGAAVERLAVGGLLGAPGDEAARVVLDDGAAEQVVVGPGRRAQTAVADEQITTLSPSDPPSTWLA